MLSRACSTSPPTFKPVATLEVWLIRAGDEAAGLRVAGLVRYEEEGCARDSSAGRVSRAGDTSPRRPHLHRGCTVAVPPAAPMHHSAGELRHRTRTGDGKCARRGRTGHDRVNSSDSTGPPSARAPA